MSTSNKAKLPVSILCFGNSLTAGYPAGQPYAIRLKDKLEDAFRGHLFSEVEYEVDGLPGDLVTRGQYIERMRGDCESDFSCVYLACLFVYYERVSLFILSHFLHLPSHPITSLMLPSFFKLIEHSTVHPNQLTNYYTRETRFL